MEWKPRKSELILRAHGLGSQQSEPTAPRPSPTVPICLQDSSHSHDQWRAAGDFRSCLATEPTAIVAVSYQPECFAYELYAPLNLSPLKKKTAHIHPLFLLFLSQVAFLVCGVVLNQGLG